MDNEINTSGGANIDGNVVTGSGDVVGRDLYVHGDKVQGMKIVLNIHASSDLSDQHLTNLSQVLTQFKNETAELNPTHFDRFIVPIWQAFTEIHENYKTTFSDYLQILATESMDIDTLAEKIQRDSLFSFDLRVELEQQITQFPNKTTSATQSALADFFAAITDYFSLPRKSASEVVGLTSNSGTSFMDAEINDSRYTIGGRTIEISNVYRTKLLLNITGNYQARNQVFRLLTRVICRIKTWFRHPGLVVTSNEGTHQAKQILQELVQDLQLNYKKVAITFFALRKVFVT